MNQHISSPSIDSLLRQKIADTTWTKEDILYRQMRAQLNLDESGWERIFAASKKSIERLRAETDQPLIDQFLTEYGVSTDEGVQLMRLAEALSRTTDPITANALIQDKLSHRNWLGHSGAGHKWVMSLSARLLHIVEKWLVWTGKPHTGWKSIIVRPGNGFLRFATRMAIKALSSQFVFAETLEGAIKRTQNYAKKGYLFSFDMLGEAARTQADAQKYYAAYDEALNAVASQASSQKPGDNHGISIKLSALHPRYEYGQAEQVAPSIASLLLPLAIKARKANVQITIDAEEAERLDISMDVLSKLVTAPELKGWLGLGFVVQAYQRRALPLLDWLVEQSRTLEAPLFIRLVKGAYWDSEVKRAQEMGLEDYPVFTRKEMTDLSYLVCAQKLLHRADHFRPQFATHNALTVAAVQELSCDQGAIEFQRLFGMGQQLHDQILDNENGKSRIYAPVGTQKDLLSYLIRRLLENGANSSFVNKLADPKIAIPMLIQNPVEELAKFETIENQNIPRPNDYLMQDRLTAKGWDLSNQVHRSRFESGMKEAAKTAYRANPIIAGKAVSSPEEVVINPATFKEAVGQVSLSDIETAHRAVDTASTAFASWSAQPIGHRASVLEKAADLLEERASIFHYLAVQEAGKTWLDAVDEVREAVDFCRYYAAQIRSEKMAHRKALGVVICISPWNFPLAIFLGQITAALAAGNTVVAKPADQTPLIAAEAIRLLHDAGIDGAAVNFVPGDGPNVGEALVAHPKTAAICFTGSTLTAKKIASRLAQLDRPMTPLIAETGGINAMIVDSTALPEQTVDDVISSAFQSAGQRCSALRLLCLQEDIADDFLTLLSGAMTALKVGNPKVLEHDIGPVIDAAAHQKISAHIAKMKKMATLIGTAPPPVSDYGYFVRPTAFLLDNFEDLDQEIFGPILHIVRFSADQKMNLVDQINQSGFGLTLGVHSRIDSACDAIAGHADVGNIYINRNQIGAVVGVQPFGGQGLSGTGPKAGGPLYLLRLSSPCSQQQNFTGPAGQNFDHHYKPTADRVIDCFKAGAKAASLWQKMTVSDQNLMTTAQALEDSCSMLLEQELQLWQALLQNIGSLPSPTGETNQYSLAGRGLIISLLRDEKAIKQAGWRAIVTGNSFLQAHRAPAADELKAWSDHINHATGVPHLVQQTQISASDNLLEYLGRPEIAAVIMAPDDPDVSHVGRAIAHRAGPIIPILTPDDLHDRFVHEKTITHNIAAAGGDIGLLNT
ncbi:MAG: bifunctional proline dehydrogenase/L-glutamate gamma-semialdehyde dehydrogenase PutA [Parasphingorhabdus sp.]|uniref:bifunctional proline dehydrogenase/L-glutamate gamma-semialdehyde dehydrogenase PutA n=1 Tax=Parasphingorhabdus sp. TaxID=2709688 RepID=UPI0032988E5E